MHTLSQGRVERLRRLEKLVARAGSAPDSCHTAAQLLVALSDAYGKGRRTLERDLEKLEAEGCIEVVNPDRKPYRYRRRAVDADGEGSPLLEEHMGGRIRSLVEAVLQQDQGRLDRLWEKLLDGEVGFLDETRLRILPDSLRLVPATLDPQVLSAVIEALNARRVLEVAYRDAEGRRTTPRLHPQALVQRGPVPYLYALKDAEVAPVRLYALHRMERARVRPHSRARHAPDFDLDALIHAGQADFGPGEPVDLELRVRGYLAKVLAACPLAADQRLEQEPEDSPFAVRLQARVPSSGSLLRWLLAAGPNLEVVAPADLRAVMVSQAARTLAVYAGAPAEAVEPCPAAATS